MKKFKLRLYMYEQASISFLPYLQYTYYPSQGYTSIGCLKHNLVFGWLVFGGTISSVHESKQWIIKS